MQHTCANNIHVQDESFVNQKQGLLWGMFGQLNSLKNTLKLAICRYLAKIMTQKVNFKCNFPIN